MSVEDQLDRLINLIEMSVDLETLKKFKKSKKIYQSFQELKVDLLIKPNQKKIWQKKNSKNLKFF